MIAFTLPTPAQDADHEAVNTLALEAYCNLRSMGPETIRTLYVGRAVLSRTLLVSTVAIGPEVGTYTCMVAPDDLRDDIADAVGSL